MCYGTTTKYDVTHPHVRADLEVGPFLLICIRKSPLAPIVMSSLRLRLARYSSRRAGAEE